MLFNIIIILILDTAIFISLYLMIKFLNRAPEKWFCDYDEVPTEIHMGKRFSFVYTGIIYSIVISLLTDVSVMQYENTALYLLIAAMGVVMGGISMSDKKYSIIPDQLTAVLFILSFIFACIDLLFYNIFLSKWYEPFLGALFGGGILFLVNLLSRVMYKKDGIGFGDVKLFSAIGFSIGLLGTAYSFLISIVLAAICLIILMLLKKINHDSYYPLGPFLCLGSMIFMAFMPYLLS